VYWQNKLKSNKNIKFPDELLDKIAAKTDKFSFAYLKEALCVSSFGEKYVTDEQRIDAPDPCWTR